MQFHGTFCDREPHAGASRMWAACMIDPVERQEDRVDLLFRKHGFGGGIELQAVDLEQVDSTFASALATLRKMARILASSSRGLNGLGR